MEYSATPNKALKIRVQLPSDATALFPQTKIYKESDDSLVATISLTHTQSGLYVGSWTNDGVRLRYYTQTIIYTDSGHTSESPVDRPDSDSINVGFPNDVGGSVLGSARGGKVAQRDLTKKEIESIAKAVMELVQPELDKQISFDPKVDKVMVDFPKAVPVDLKPIETKVDDLFNSIEDVRANVNNNGVGVMDELKKSIQDIKKEWTGKDGKVAELLDKVETKISESTDVLKDKLDKADDGIEAVKSFAKVFDDEFSSTIQEHVNKVLETTLSGKELQTLKKSEMFEKTMGNMFTNMSKQNIRASARAGDVKSVFEQLKGLSVKEKADMFAELLETYPNLIKQMNKLANA